MMNKNVQSFLDSEINQNQEGFSTDDLGMPENSVSSIRYAAADELKIIPIAHENIYVHVPFCAHLCHYCAFEKSLNLSQIDPWLDQIVKEANDFIEKKLEENPDWKIETLYFGGGTPSVLNQEQLRRLSKPFLKVLSFREDYEARNEPSNKEQKQNPSGSATYEWTIEVNPETVDQADLNFYRQSGINRLSIGIQSFDDEVLKRINRKHSSDQALKVIEQARKAGFENISCDLIFALPGQDFESVKHDVKTFIDLGIEHISIYSLQIEENSVFGKQNLKPVDSDLEADEFEWIIAALKEAGYEHYEISSFVKNRKYSRHNLSVWMAQNYAGIGFGACGRNSNGYYHHDNSLFTYMKEEPKIEYDGSDFYFTDLMLGLRTQFGVDIQQWNQNYSSLFGCLLPDLIFRMNEENRSFFEIVIIDKKERLCLNEKGREILNTILFDLLEVMESSLDANRSENGSK